VALRSLGQRQDFESWEGTATFIDIVIHWWDIVIVHHPFAGRNTRRQNAFPIFSASDSKLKWLLKMSEWLNRWYVMSDNGKVGFLSKDTYAASSHTLKAFVMLVKYLFSKYELSIRSVGKISNR